MIVSQNSPKIVDTIYVVARSIRNSDTPIQMNINKIEPKIADTSRLKYQKF